MGSYLGGIIFFFFISSIGANAASLDKKNFDIEAQKMSKALILFSEQSDLVFVIPTNLIKGKTVFGGQRLDGAV